MEIEKKLKKTAELGKQKAADIKDKLEFEKLTKVYTEKFNKKMSELKEEVSSSEDILAKPKEYVQTLLFPEEAENISKGEQTKKEGALEKTLRSTEEGHEDKTNYPRKLSFDNLEEMLKEMDEMEIKEHMDTLRKEMREICRTEIEHEKNLKKRYFTVATCAGVFFAFLLLYTTAIAFNNTGYINSLSAGINNMQSMMMYESRTVNKKINEIDMFIGNTARSEHMKKIRMDSPVKEEQLQNAMLMGKQTDNVMMPEVSGVRVFPAAGQDSAVIHSQIQEPVRYIQPAIQAESLEQQASRTNQNLAGITYKMYANTQIADRLNILATHFRTNTVLMEYMLKTMAVNSGPMNIKKTDEQVRQNLKAILDTAAGKKMLAVYSLWQMAYNDPEILAEIDVKLIENEFYGLSFIPAVENALLN